MRIDIDGVGSDAALDRARGRKRVGRKHNHQPRGRARDKRLRRHALALAQMLERRRAFSERVAAYWRGDRETYPTMTGAI